MKIISLAGHIDHGKTSLIAAISGFWGDESRAEKERGITIDLSFSDYLGISFIDVPGHEQLLRTMLRAIATEYALLVVDINEGLMPQTYEHIFALQVMGVQNIILALNKIDAFNAHDFGVSLNSRAQEILDELSELGCKIKKHFCLSAKTKEGVDELRNYLLALPKSQSRANWPLRLYVDRVFNIPGTGEVASAFLSGGTLSAKTLYSNGEQIKIRSLQAQHKQIDEICAPARVAFAYRGKLDTSSVIAEKGALKKSKWLHASIVKSPNAPHLADGACAFFASFNQQFSCRVYAVGDFVRLEFERGVISCFDDPFVLLANGRCVAGGRVLSSVVEPLKKGKMIELLTYLKNRDFARAFSILNHAHGGGFGLFCAEQRFGMSTKEALKIAQKGCELINYEGANCFSIEFKNKLAQQIKKVYEKNHFAMQSAASLAKTFQTDAFICEQVLRSMDGLRKVNGLYVRADVSMQKAEQSAQERLYAAIDKIDPAAPYNIYEELDLDRKFGDEILKNFTKTLKAVRLAHNYFISTKALKNALENIATIGVDGVGVQELKIKLGLSRKYAIALLEYASALPGVKTVENKRYFGQDFKFILRR